MSGRDRLLAARAARGRTRNGADAGDGHAGALADVALRSLAPDAGDRRRRHERRVPVRDRWSCGGGDDERPRRRRAARRRPAGARGIGGGGDDPRRAGSVPGPARAGAAEPGGRPRRRDRRARPGRRGRHAAGRVRGGRRAAPRGVRHLDGRGGRHGHRQQRGRRGARGGDRCAHAHRRPRGERAERLCLPHVDAQLRSRRRRAHAPGVRPRRSPRAPHAPAGRVSRRARGGGRRHAARLPRRTRLQRARSRPGPRRARRSTRDACRRALDQPRGRAAPPGDAAPRIRRRGRPEGSDPAHPGRHRAPRRPRHALGRTGRRRRAIDRARARRGRRVERPRADEPGARRGRLRGRARARRADRAWDLRHAAVVRQPRPRARDAAHGHDARRDLPHRGRPHLGAAARPALHRLGPAPARGDRGALRRSRVSSARPTSTSAGSRYGHVCPALRAQGFRVTGATVQ